MPWPSHIPPPPTHPVTGAFVAGYGSLSDAAATIVGLASLDESHTLDPAAVGEVIFAGTTGTTAHPTMVEDGTEPDSTTPYCSINGTPVVEEAANAIDWGLNLAHGMPYLTIAAVEGPGTTVNALAILAKYARVEPVKAVGFPYKSTPSLTDNSWIEAVSTIRDLMFSLPNLEQLAQQSHNLVDFTHLIALAGFYIGLAGQSKPIIVCDPASLAAATVAEKLAPGVKNWVVLGAYSRFPVVKLAAKALLLEAAIPLELALGNRQAGNWFLTALLASRSATATESDSY